MAERMETEIIHSAISLNTITDFNFYGLDSSLCCVDVKLTAPAYASNGDARAPIDLVAVIDRSGSMSGKKLDLVINVLHFVALHLKSIDRFAIVTYDNNVDELVSLKYVTQKNGDEFDSKISRITAGGGTNLSAGLIKGMNILKGREKKKADVASLLLFTDGMANCGITNTPDIITAMQNIFAGKNSFTVNTFGFGSDHNADMLKEISTVGKGLFYFIRTTEQIPEIFTNCLGGLLSTVGQNISISIQTSNGATIKEIVSKEKPVLSDGNKKGVVSMGDLQSEEERDILVDLNLPQVTAASQYVYAKVILEYFNVIKKDNDQYQIEIEVERRSDLSARVPSLEVDEQRNRIKTIASLAQAAELAEKGKLKEASRVIAFQHEYNSKSSSLNSPRVISLNRDLNNAYHNVSNKKAYSSGGKSSLYSMTYSHISQRSATTPSYSTPSRDSTYSSYINATTPACVTPRITPLPRLERALDPPPADAPTLPPRIVSQSESTLSPPSLPKRVDSLYVSETLSNEVKADPEKGPPFISEI